MHNFKDLASMVTPKSSKGATDSWPGQHQLLQTHTISSVNQETRQKTKAEVGGRTKKKKESKKNR